MEDSKVNFNSRKQGGEPEKAFVKTCKMLGADFGTIQYPGIIFALDGSAVFTWVYNPDKCVNSITVDSGDMEAYESIEDDDGEIARIAITRALIESCPKGSDYSWRELLEKDMCEQAEKRGQWRYEDD
jgi:hypothetical protein